MNIKTKLLSLSIGTICILITIPINIISFFAINKYVNLPQGATWSIYVYYFVRILGVIFLVIPGKITKGIVSGQSNWVKFTFYTRWWLLGYSFIAIIYRLVVDYMLINLITDTLSGLIFK